MGEFFMADVKKQIIDYLNELSYLKKSHIKVVQIAKDVNCSMYDSSNTLEELSTDGLLLKRYEVIDLDSALNYGCFLNESSIPKEYVTDDGISLVVGKNAKIKVFYRYPNAHSKI